MKTYEEVEVYHHAFVTWTLDGGEWSSRTFSYILSTYQVGGCVDTRAGLDVVAKREIPAFARNRTPSSSLTYLRFRSATMEFYTQ
jgi:hypothetical protein